MVTPPNNSYAPPKSDVADVATTDADSQKATRGSRFGASFIDGLILTIPFIPSYFIAITSVMSHARMAGAGKMNPIALWAALFAAGGWFYVGLLATICTAIITTVLVQRNGQTIGKKWVGIKVVRTDGSRATLGRIFGLRYLANTVLAMIPFFGSLYILVDSLFIFGEAKRCCHDYIADTIVVRA